jgi:hypothetical protein
VAAGRARAPERIVKLVDALLEDEDLAALLEEEVLAEAAAADHLEREPAHVADPVFADATERPPLPPECAGRPCGRRCVGSRRNRPFVPTAAE